MTDQTLRSVRIERTATGRYTVHNPRGGSISIGAGDQDFSPVELLLAAMGACTAIDVDAFTSRRAEPGRFSVLVTGDKIRDDSGGNRMVNLKVEFDVAFPPGTAGEKAREALPGLVRLSHDRLCTVSRTVEAGTPVVASLAGEGTA